MKAFAIAFCIAALGLCAACQPPVTLLSAAAGAGLTWAAMNWRYGKIIAAAKAAAHAFCFSDGGLAEIRKMSEIILTWRN